VITKEELLSDKAGLEKQRDQLIAQLNAVSGALKYIADKLKEENEDKENQDE
jgi:hypothetical protein